ncbi:MAG: hypothetical protein ACXABX_06005 [Candidatus Thorarchaeota archaeon]|jgi:hypothetical protein
MENQYGFAMDEHCETLDTEEGIVVDTSLDVLRRAAIKVLYEFNESIIDMDGEVRPSGSEIRTGDTVLFEEKIQNCPARVVAVKIIRNFWYVNTTSETPKSGYPSGRDAMKAAEMDEQNLRILERFLIEEAGADNVRDVDDWKPDLKGEAADVLGLVGKVAKRWT